MDKPHPSSLFFLFFCLRRNILHSDNELKTWRLATVILVLLATFVFLIQRFIGQFFDVFFEIFIFYAPTFVIVVLFLYFRRKPKV